MEISETPAGRLVRAGDHVRVRQLPWVVASVEPHGGCTVVSLTAASPDQDTRALTVIAPFDDIQAIRTSDLPLRTGRGRWRTAARMLLAAHGPAGTLKAASSAAMTLLPYQLEPAIALLHGHGCRLLLADDVGLGKTVQALLALAELRGSGVVSRALVLCPAGLRDQWAAEAGTRFGIDLAVVDQEAMRRSRRDLPPEVNPWSVPPVVVTSVDFVKRPEVLPLALRAPWDLVVVDEAHGTTGSTDRHEAVSALCARAAYVLLLTATPHSGNDDAFRSLVDTGAHGDPLLVFRRTRREIGLASFRRIHTRTIVSSSAERAMHAALDAFAAEVRRERRHRGGGDIPLFLALLYKRACSGAFALAESVQRRLAMLEADSPEAAEEQLLLPIADEGELDAADVPPMWREPALHDVARERRLLSAVLGAARVAEGADSKQARLRRLLGRVREPVIVFTEYRDTLLHLRRQVAPSAAVVHGGLTREERRAALAEFARTGVLLATDAAGEGLNLQEHCRLVVSLELPWNPMRLEQRIGRVDRIGQVRRVHAVHLVSASREMGLLARLTARVRLAAERIAAPRPLGDPPPWTEQRAAALVMGVDAAGGDAEPDPRVAVPLVRFADEARTAAAQVGLARCLGRRQPSARIEGACETIGSRPLVAWSRHAATRTAARGGVIAVLRTDQHDATGRLVATLVTPVLADLRVSPADVVRALHGAAPAAMRAGIHEWLAASEERTRRRAGAVRVRLQAMAAEHAVTPAPHQPGLFDRRAERLHADRERLRDEWLAWLESRMADLDAATTVTVSGPRVALLLYTRGGHA